MSGLTTVKTVLDSGQTINVTVDDGIVIQAQVNPVNQINVKIEQGASQPSQIRFAAPEKHTVSSATVNPSFSFNNTFVSNSTRVYKNGAYKTKDVDYTEKVDRSGIDWIGTLYDDDLIEVNYAIF